MKEKTKKSKAHKLRSLFTSNWISKLVSLFIAMGVWFAIFLHLQKVNKEKETPVPGTIPIPETPEPPTPTIPILSPSTAIPGGK